jgi:hypothetical protein
MRMTEQQYVALAAACDRLLRAPTTSLARLAIPALHFLNEHPGSLAQYAALLDERTERHFANIPRTVIRAARGLLRSLGATAPDYSGLLPVDVMIVSHLLKPEQLQRDTDFYFGAMQRYFRDQGARALLVFIDHLPAGQRGPRLRSLPADRMILPGAVSWSTEANIWRQCVRAVSALRRERTTAGNAADGGLALLASGQAVAAATVENLRMHAALAQLCRTINPRIVITTYEGTVAERLVWHAARTAERPPLCVGYQHAMVLQRAHAIRRPVAAAGMPCDPDVILTLGPVPHIALAASPGLQATRFIEYGSHRRAELPDLMPREDRPRRCLVLPDASDQECATLFEFALRCARLSPDIGFALRPHPMVDAASLLRRHLALRKLPENVSLSMGTPLEQELARTRYCLYRGSSAALYAVRAGIKPFYLARPKELAFDCLHGLSDWRETVSSPEELVARIRLTDSFPDAAAARAANLCNGFVSEVRPAAIQALLAMAGSHRPPAHDIVRKRSAEMHSRASPAR